ncbi:MAG: GGDEF domain-containing protein [Clostridia bacterium]|nr:GGDEF domain-containing protein [Clostridia bacterium]
MYYSSFGLLSFIITLIINHAVFKAKKDAGKVSAKLRYKRFLACIMVYFISDMLWGVLYENKLIPLVYADTAIYFFVMVLSVFLWTEYVVDYLSRKNVMTSILKWAGRIMVFAELSFLAVNIFVPIVFRFDENGVYYPGDARYITLAAQIALYLATAVSTLHVALRSEGKERLHNRTIGFSGIIMTAFILLQTLFPLLPFYAIGCLLATCLIHTFITEDEKKARDSELGSAKQKAYTDSLTGVKNAHAYSEARDAVDKLIAAGGVKEFAVAVFDLNGLKKVNDTKGHEAGDKYIKDGSRIICGHFKHSPVFRIGGDEFVAFLEGEDYKERRALMESFDRQAEANLKEGLIVVAGGISEYIHGQDHNCEKIFERADRNMYERKRRLKEMV